MSFSNFYFVFFFFLLHTCRTNSTVVFDIEYHAVEIPNEIQDKEIQISEQLLNDFEEWKRLKGKPLKAKVEDSLPTPDMIRSYGYIAEIHQYNTADGYINTLHRIPPKDSNGRVIFLQHGLLGTSADFVMGSPPKSLGYILSDLGYDVWLGNARGNAYSRDHVSLTTNDTSYWSFSFDEMGKYDLPAAFDYILNLTSSKDLTYIGHSMGTVMFWVSMHQDNNRIGDQVKLMIAMGPVAKVGHMKSPIRFLSPFIKEFEYIFWLLGVNEFVPSNRLIQLFDEYVCDATMRQLKLCENICFLLVGFDAPQTNLTMLPIILGHEPGGTSARTVIHFAQEISSGNFCRYDFGSPSANLKAYNSTTPPNYDLSRVTVPVALFWSDNDWLADPRDVEYLSTNLPNVVYNRRIPLPKFNHIDFLWGLDADVLVYNQIISLLNSEF